MEKPKRVVLLVLPLNLRITKAHGYQGLQIKMKPLTSLIIGIGLITGFALGHKITMRVIILKTAEKMKMITSLEL